MRVNSRSTYLMVVQTFAYSTTAQNQLKKWHTIGGLLLSTDYNEVYQTNNSMNSGQSSTILNDMLTDFVDYVYSFYGDKKEALYPLFNVDTDKQVDKTDILGAVYDYLHEITRRNDDHFTWGDGDSLDRERVRDILVIKYGYDKTFYGGSVLWEDFANGN